MRWSSAIGALVRVSNEPRKRSNFFSLSGLSSNRLWHEFTIFNQRLAALENSVSLTGSVLTGTQVVAL